MSIRCAELIFALQKMLLSGSSATLNFYLTNFTDESTLVNAVRSIRYLDGNTNTTGALRLMRTEIFNPANGDRLDVPNVAILITDGEPTYEVAGLDEEVLRIKNSGVRIVGVGVTNAVSDSAAMQIFSIISENLTCISSGRSVKFSLLKT